MKYPTGQRTPSLQLPVRSGTPVASLRDRSLGGGNNIKFRLILLSWLRPQPPTLPALARANAVRAGAGNVEFQKGDIEAIPLPDASVDVIISNCVINLSADKPTVLREAFRVLKPGGRFAVSDVIVRGEVSAAVRRSMELWVSCVAGALEEREFRSLLEGVGFPDVDIEPTRVYRLEDARSFLAAAGLDRHPLLGQAAGRFISAFVRGTKGDVQDLTDV